MITLSSKMSMTGQDKKNTHYLVVNCGYTRRLIPYIGEMDPKPILIYDRNYAKGIDVIESYGATEQELALFTGPDPNYGCGIIVFGSNEKLDRLAICDMLARYKHCAFFSIIEYDDSKRSITEADLDNPDFRPEDVTCGSLYRVKRIKLLEVDITVMTFDTESG